MSRDHQPVATSVVVAIILIVILALLTGCGTTAPVVARFPEPPGRGAATACPDLKKLEDGARLSDVANTVNINYQTYWECAVKVDTWIQWYSNQKLIFESVR